jgi:hypothetical protein
MAFWASEIENSVLWRSNDEDGELRECKNEDFNIIILSIFLFHHAM